jgi:hypothetical protein
LLLISPGHLPSARTSAGNEYKAKKKEAAAETQLAVDLGKSIQGKAAMGGALRHALDRTSAVRQLSTVSFEIFRLGGWTAKRAAIATAQS